ncbi:MAG: DUF4349 domain-containing protein [Acidimicrobiales bacterium]
MDQIAASPGAAARVRWEVGGRQALGAAGLLVLGLVGAAGLAGALATQGATATPSAPRAAVLYAVGAVPAGPWSRSTEAPGAGSSAASRGGSGLAVNGGVEAAAPPSTPPDGRGTLIEETGAITVVMPGAEIQSGTTALMNLATAYGGFVASTLTQAAAPGSPAQATVTLQVPEDRFGQVLNAVKGYGKVSSLTTQATDVTGQYVDLQAQITALQDSRQQYLTIMTKATTIGGILSVQSQLDTLQSQLDQLQGQLRALNSETTYATLAVTLTQKLVAPPPPKPRSGLDKAWNGAVNGFVAGCEGVVRLAGPILFALLLGAALFVMGRTAWRLGRR